MILPNGKFVIIPLLAALIVAPALSYGSCTAQALANSYNLPNGQCFQITGPNCICRNVTNNAPNGLALFIPAKTTAEWSAFYNSPPNGVTAVTCSTDAFAFGNPITINDTLVGGATQTNFPMLFSGTYSYLATTANGGDVETANGWDIIFTSDAAGNNRLNYELESYNATTGNIQVWVQVPSVSNTSNTTIYLWYGKACLSSQANASAVWDSNYLSVWHLTNGSVLSVKDSTSNAYNGTITGQTANNMASTGLIDGGAAFNAASSQYLMSPSYGVPPASVTITAWVKPTATGGCVLDELGSAALEAGWHDSQIEVETTNIMKACIWTGSEQCVSSAAGSVTYGNWYYMGMTYNSPTTTLTGYLNAVGTTATLTKLYPNTNLLYYAVAGHDNTDGGATAYFTGNVDEVRISNIARSSSWMTAEYNNQSSPSTFYTIGAQTSHWYENLNRLIAGILGTRHPAGRYQ